MGNQDNTGDYDLAAIRELLLKAFEADELRRFCQYDPYFKPVVDRFALGDTFETMVDKLILYCQKHLFFVELLAAVKEVNPRQYERFHDRLCLKTTPQGSTGLPPVGPDGKKGTGTKPGRLSVSRLVGAAIIVAALVIGALAGWGLSAVLTGLAGHFNEDLARATPTATATDTPTPTATATDTPTPTSTPTSIPAESVAPTNTNTVAPTDTPTATPTWPPTAPPTATRTRPPSTRTPTAVVLNAPAFAERVLPREPGIVSPRDKAGLADHLQSMLAFCDGGGSIELQPFAPGAGDSVGYRLSYRSIPAPPAFCCWSMRFSPISLAGLSTLSFDIRGEAGGEAPNVYLVPPAGAASYVKVRNYTPVSSKWQQVTVPLDAFGLSQAAQIRLCFEWGDMSGTIYVDSFRFE